MARIISMCSKPSLARSTFMDFNFNGGSHHRYVFQCIWWLASDKGPSTCMWLLVGCVGVIKWVGVQEFIRDCLHPLFVSVRF